jgi:hypothetical protein
MKKTTLTKNKKVTKPVNQRSGTSALDDEYLLSAPIDFHDAAVDIVDLLIHKKIQGLTSLALGGMFCVEHFFSPASNTDQGVLMWYCLNRVSNPTVYPKFFVSIEQADKGIINEDLAPDRKKLRHPLKPYLYDEVKTDVTVVKRYLQKDFDKPDCSEGGVFPKISTQLKYIQEFRKYLNDNPRTGKIPFNQKDWAYFQNNLDKDVGKGMLTHLITQQEDIQYVRYYFGYHEGQTKKNTIRIILFAVGKDGKNITNYIIQKSIPPADVTGRKTATNYAMQKSTHPAGKKSKK